MYSFRLIFICYFDALLGVIFCVAFLTRPRVKAYSRILFADTRKSCNFVLGRLGLLLWLIMVISQDVLNCNSISFIINVLEFPLETFGLTGSVLQISHMLDTVAHNNILMSI